MSFYKLSEKTDYVEQQMQRKMHPIYYPRLPAPDGRNMDRADHYVHAYDEYWRSELPKPLRFVVDPHVRSSAYEKEQERAIEAEKSMVKALDKVYDEPSDDLAVVHTKSRKK